MYSSDGRTARAQNLACRWFDSFYIHIFSKLIRLDHDILSLNFDYSANVKLLQVWVGEEAVLKTVEVENLCRFESCLQRHGFVAPMVERRFEEPRSNGSSPFETTICLVDEIGRRLGLKIPWKQFPCRFDSDTRYHIGDQLKGRASDFDSECNGSSPLSSAKIG